ncbi:MAG: restriction endonuclease subunit R [Cyanobacteria bacterium P01_E01_bin.42]
MTALQARNLTIGEVRKLLGFQERSDNSFESLLSLEPITESEQQELKKIYNDFLPSLETEEVLEGQVRLIAVAPLLRLAGFYRYPIQMQVEKNIERIEFEDNETIISGRFDIVAVNKERSLDTQTDIWILVIETKKGLTEPFYGLPQLLTHAYKSLEYQENVWGLATNGLSYLFVYIQKGEQLTYQYMPPLSLLDLQSASKLLQVLKAIAIL